MSLLKKKFGKFAVSQKEMTSILGGYIDPCTDMFKCDDEGGGGGGEYACNYQPRNGSPTQGRTQYGFSKQQAEAFEISLTAQGFQVACYKYK